MLKSIDSHCGRVISCQTCHYILPCLQCCLTIDDIVTHCVADNNGDRFLNIERADLQPHLDYINDRSVVETLKHGIEYYHKALEKTGQADCWAIVICSSWELFHSSANCIKGMYHYWLEVLYSDWREESVRHCLVSSWGRLHGHHYGSSLIWRQGAPLFSHGCACHKWWEEHVVRQKTNEVDVF